MVKHLLKSTNAFTVEGIELTRMACVNNPMIRGLALPRNEFEKIPVTSRCKKCQAILEKKMAKEAREDKATKNNKDYTETMVMYKGQLVKAITFDNI